MIHDRRRMVTAFVTRRRVGVRRKIHISVRASSSLDYRDSRSTRLADTSPIMHEYGAMKDSSTVVQSGNATRCVTTTPEELFLIRIDTVYMLRHPVML